MVVWRKEVSLVKVAHLQEHALKEQKGMKAATNGLLSEMSPVGPAESLEEVSVPSFPCHSCRVTVPSALPSEPIV